MYSRSVPLLTAGALLWLTAAFNLDVDQPHVFSGPGGSSFGFSVVLLEDSRGRPWLLAGAPQGNDSRMKKVVAPGCVYKCPLSAPADQCDTVELNTLGNTLINFIQQNVSNQWRGMSMALNSNNSDVIICGPRWKIVNTDVKRENWLSMNGKCYKISRDFQYNKKDDLQPLELIEEGKQTKYEYRMAGMGTSVHFTKDSSKLIIGAPGMKEFGGGILVYNSTRSELIRTTNISYSYIGYSLTSGQFFTGKKTDYAAGAPHMDGYGAVVIYKSELGPVLIVRPTSKYAQLGSNFGAAVCAIDLDHDGFDDLLVGAPMYFNKTSSEEQGLVFVYHSDGQNLSLWREVSGNRVPHGRFGSTIVNAGDVNKDGFDDIIIGAPYEEDNSGSIYIYNGDSSGLEFTASQRILGKTIQENMRGFGTSVSNLLDVDNNGYGDVAVGAYVSHQVAVLRARPVVHLVHDISFEPSKIYSNRTCSYKEEDLSCVDMQLNLSYDTTNQIHRKLDLQTEFFLKAGSRQFGFLVGGTLQKVVVFNRSLSRNTETLHFTVIVLDNADKLNPLELELQYKQFDATDKLEIYPVLKPGTVIKKLYFAVGCGPDNVCETDLKLAVKYMLPDNHLSLKISDSPSNFSLFVQVNNTLENAFNSSVIVSFPSFIYYEKTELYSGSLDCEPVPLESKLLCAIKNPMLGKSSLTSRLHFKAKNLPRNDSFVMNVYVSTKSTDNHLDNNNVSLSIPVQMEAQLTYVGFSEPEQLKITEMQESQTVVSHIYSVFNSGPSPLLASEMTIGIPQLSDAGEDLIRINNFTVLGSEVCRCFVNSSNDGPVEDHLLQDAQNTDIIDCAVVSCKIVHCKCESISTNKEVKVYVVFKISKKISSHLKEGKKLVITSNATFVGEHHPMYTTRPQQKFQVSTELLSTTEHSVDIGIIIGSIVGGLIMLLLLCIICWKCGFFKRKKKSVETAAESDVPPYHDNEKDSNLPEKNETKC